jgi:hypothetical protein
MTDTLEERVTSLEVGAFAQAKLASQARILTANLIRQQRRLASLEAEHSALHLVLDELFVRVAWHGDGDAFLRTSFDEVMAHIDQMEIAKDVPKTSAAVRVAVERLFSSLERKVRDCG